MSKPFLRFEDGKISLAGKDLLVQSADLSITPTLSAERVYGDYDAAIAGAKTEFIDFAPQGNIQGQLDIKFLISAETFAESGVPNNINRLFDIKDGMSEAPINRNIVGRYSFDNMYLKSFGFSLEPFRVIEANASYDIYGTINRTGPGRFTRLSADFAHGLKSFGLMEANGASADSATQLQFEITSLKYNIVVNRKVHNRIRSSENTLVSTDADGVVPSRVSIESIESEMSIDSNGIIPDLNAYGDQQTTSYIGDRNKSEIEAFLKDINGNKIARFKTSGRIQQQSYSVSEGQQSIGSITIKEIIK
jgi:hypothetical protein